MNINRVFCMLGYFCSFKKVCFFFYLYLIFKYEKDVGMFDWL